MSTREALHEEAMRRFETGFESGGGVRRFEETSRDTFALQFECCEPYRRYCESRNVTPADAPHWSEIPLVPVSAFQETEIRSGAGPAVRVFETSGTRTTRRGRHVLDEPALALYRAALVPTFRHFVLPELDRYARRTRTQPTTAHLPIVLGPTAEAMPSSSLYYMIDEACRTLCHAPARYVLGPGGVDLSAARSALGEAERAGRGVLLLGTALAIDALCDALEGAGLRFHLAESSRVMETGGLKGSGRQMTPTELRVRIHRLLGVAPYSVVGEYGMTEALSQFYDDSMLAPPSACRWDHDPEEPFRAPRRKRGAPWTRVVVRDPETLAPVPIGTEGVVSLVDLANLHTLSFLLTEDRAVAHELEPDGIAALAFEVLGRWPRAEARGCSLTAEQWTQVTG